MDDADYAAFTKHCGELQQQIAQKTVTERLGLEAQKLDDFRKAKIEEVAQKIIQFLRAGIENPFAVRKIRDLIGACRNNPFAMNAMKCLLEDMSTKATDQFSVDQLTGIVGELNMIEKGGSKVTVAVSEEKSGEDKEEEETSQFTSNFAYR
jgi:hypothetical protein